MEAHQVNVLPFAVLRDLEKIDYAEEAGLPREHWRDIGQTDGLDRVYFYFASLHGIAGADADMGIFPDPDAAGDFSSTNSFAEALGEDHDESLYQGEGLDETWGFGHAFQKL